MGCGGGSLSFSNRTTCLRADTVDIQGGTVKAAAPETSAYTSTSNHPNFLGEVYVTGGTGDGSDPTTAGGDGFFAFYEPISGSLFIIR